MVRIGFRFRAAEGVVFTPTLHHAAPPAEDAVCAKSFSEPPTKNHGSGAAGSGCLKLQTPNFVYGIFLPPVPTFFFRPSLSCQRLPLLGQDLFTAKEPNLLQAIEEEGQKRLEKAVRELFRNVPKMEI